MATIVYLDIDDEITSAAARIRAPGDRRLAIVLPAGSRVSTSRINFRLLAREAASYGRDLVIVAPEAGTRSLAIAAGLPAFMSVSEYEDALEGAGPDEPFDGNAGTGADTVAGVAGDAVDATVRANDPGEVGAAARAESMTHAGAADAEQATRVRLPDTGPRQAVGPHGAFSSVRARSAIRDTVTMPLPDVPDEPRRRRFSGWLLAVASILIVAILASGTAAWLFLPTAVVTVHARVEPVGPVEFTVRADPLEVTVDPVAGVVPAEVATFDLAVSGDFPASGKKVTETKASGSVRWTNCDPTRSYTIPPATITRTKDGQKFATADAVFLPVAILTGNPPAITCQSRDVGVTASDPGTAGNVDKGSITVVPSTYNSVVIRVSNPAAITGGTHTEAKVVAQKDVDAAMTTLSKALRDEFTSQLSDPAKTPPGLALFPATKSMSSGEPTVDPDSFVGQVAPTFTLGLTATGTATAVDLSLVRQVGDRRIRAAVSANRFLVGGSVDVQLGQPHVDGSAVLYPVTAHAGQVQTLDAIALRRVVKGLSVDEARERLRDYGDATVDVWPGWVTTITTYDFRLEVHVVSDVPLDQGGAGASPSAVPSVSPSTVSPSAAPSGM